MEDAFRLLRAWGFTVKTIMTWEKITKAGNTRMSTGNWFRSATEHCIIAAKGKVRAFNSDSKIAARTPNFLRTEYEDDFIDTFPPVLSAQRREHSRKPDEFYRLVEEVCKGEKLEMFARQRRHGWDCHGDQVDMFEAEALDARTL
jgi:N6-adenosine-specific RNA methylase IME4